MPSHPGVVNANADANGSATAIIQHNKSGILWDIQQISVASSPPGPLNVETRFNAFPLLSPVSILSGATAQGEPSIEIHDHDLIQFIITGAVANSVITIAYYYDEKAA